MSRLLTVLLLVLFAAPTFAAPVPKSLKKKPPLRAKIEPRPGEKLYTADFDDVSFSKVAEWLEKHTEMMFITKDKPDVKITLRVEKACQAELFAQLDDLLYRQGWVVTRKAVSFSTIPVKDLSRYAQHIPLIDLKELDRRSLYSPVQVIVQVGKENVEAGIALAKEVKEEGFEVSSFGVGKLLVRGLTKDVRKLVDDLGDHVKK